MQLLLIEDDEKIQAYIAKGLEEVGHRVESANDGEAGVILALENHYDCLIVDRMLPKKDGLTIVKELRAKGNSVPVLILSALGEVDDRVLGLRSGGNDYLTKPFAFIELLARVEVLGQSSLPQILVLKAKDLKIDVLSRKVTRADTEIDLQAREYKLLEFLLQHKNKVVTRTMLLEAVWDYHFDPMTGVIDVHMSRLRKKLNDVEGKLIKTVRGTGYSIED